MNTNTFPKRNAFLVQTSVLHDEPKVCANTEYYGTMACNHLADEGKIIVIKDSGADTTILERKGDLNPSNHGTSIRIGPNNEAKTDATTTVTQPFDCAVYTFAKKNVESTTSSNLPWETSFA